MTTLMTMMIVVVMGNLLVQINAECSHFKDCYSGCLVVCKSHTKFPKSILCPLTCLMTCLVPTLPSPSPSSDMVLTNKIDNTDYFCKLGCATHHCVSPSSLQNPSKFPYTFFRKVKHFNQIVFMS